MMKKSATIILITLFATSVLGQSFKKLNEDSGLSSRRTYSICQDKKGFIWISTKLAIDRYDGKNVVSYGLHSPNTSTDNIGFNFVTISPDSALWAFTQNGDIYKYNENHDDFEFIYSIRDYYHSYSIILNNIFFESPTTLLLATSKGVLRLFLDKNIAQNLVSNLEVFHILKQDDSYYLSTTNGVYVVDFQLNGKNKILHHYLKNIFINKIFYDTRFQQFWIGSISDGIYIFSKRKNSFITQILPVIGKPIRSIIQYSPTQLAVGIDGKGVYFINRENFIVENKMVKTDESIKSISGNSIWDVFMDKQHILWISTYHEGISYFDYSKLSFQNITHENRNNNSLANNYVNVVLEDSQNNLWFGTNNGVSVFYPKTGIWKHLFQQENMATGNVVLALCESENGTIWAGGYAFGVAEIDKKTLAIKRHSVKDKNTIIGTNHIYSIYKDEFSSNLWFGGIYGKVSSYNPVTKNVRFYGDEALRCFYSFNDSIMLLGLYRGVYMLNKNTGEKTETKIHSIVNKILKDTNKSFWIATTKDGLIHYDFNTDSLVRYTKSNSSIASNHVYSLEKDEDGMIWITTENGLNKFNPKTKEFVFFDKRDGLVSNQFTPNASSRLSTGAVLMGSADGAVIFNPHEIVKTNKGNFYRLVFTDFLLFGNSVKVNEYGSPLLKPINETHKIKLSHNKNYFTFKFNQPNYQTSDKTEYSYLLENFDLDWSPLSTSNTAEYSKIQPGKYVFHVRSYVDKQLKEERKISIIIAQPWWNTFWAWAVYFLLFTFLGYLLLRYFSRKKEKKYFEEKMDFFINTAHDILTPLNLIESPLKDISIISNLSEDIKYLVSLALNNTQKLHNFIHQLIDFQRITLQTDALVVRRYNVKDFFLMKTTAYKAIVSQKYISIDLIIPEEEKELLFDKEKVSKMVDNLLSNSIKNTPFGGRIQIIVDYEDNGWYFKIKDNGVGITKLNQNFLNKLFFRKYNDLEKLNVGSGMGIKMVDALVRIHQGKISFNSNQNDGTIFTITLPYKFDEKFINTLQINDETEKFNFDKKINDKLLIVVSENDLKEYLGNAFRNEFIVNVQKTGNEALSQLSKFQPNLIITDEILSDMEGIEFCNKINNNHEISPTPIIVITNHSDVERIKMIFKSGASDYLKKPFDLDVLRMKIENLISLKKVWQKKALTDAYNNNIDILNSNRDRDFMHNLIQLIEENICNPDLNINLLCGELALSRTSLYNRITELTGESPNVFIRNIRLKKAAKLLIEGKHTIAEISTMIGIDNPKYFSRIFKEYYKVSPKNYLK